MLLLLYSSSSVVVVVVVVVVCIFLSKQNQHVHLKIQFKLFLLGLLYAIKNLHTAIQQFTGF